MLRTRLVRRGITPAAAGTALMLAADTLSADFPTQIVESTMAITFHHAPAAAAARLADAFLRSAVRAKLAAGGLVGIVILAGVAWAAGPGRDSPPSPPRLAVAVHGRRAAEDGR